MKRPIMLIAMVAAISARAATEPLDGYTWTYNVLADGTAEIAGVSPAPTDIATPATLGGRTVSCIGENAFCGCAQLKLLTIGSGVKRIGPFAFKDCPELGMVHFPTSVKYIDYEAFRDCGKLTTVIFESNILDVEDDAFKGCTNLTSVILNSSDLVPWCVGKFQDPLANPLFYAGQLYAPYFGGYQKSLAIPSGVTRIGHCVFAGCDATNVTIAASVRSIGTAAFLQSSLKSVRFLGLNVTNIEENAFTGCTMLKDMVIPPSVKRIGSSAFAYSVNLASVSIPKSVTSIGALAFYGTALKSVFVDYGDIDRVKAMLEDSGCDTTGINFKEDWLSEGIAYFNSNGGPGESALRFVLLPSRTIGETSAADLIPPTWAGHEFLGWFTERTGGTQVTSSFVLKEKDYTFYAHWKLKQYKLSFVANGGSVTPAYKMVDYCKTCDTFPTPTWGGHEFLGWFTARSGGTQVTAPWKCTGNKTVYAQWKVKQYKLTFDANGGKASPTYAMVDYCKTYNSFPTPTWGGHTFNGWFTARTGGTQVTAATKCVGNATIYAQWTVKQYTITFNANGGSVSPTSQKVNYCATYTLPAPKWSGHTFDGWYTAKTGGTKVTSPAKCVGNATLYARWK